MMMGDFDRIKKACVGLLTLCLVVGVMCAPIGAFGVDRAAALMAKMRASMQALGGYEAAFVVAAGDEQLLGRFAVEGERYRIDMADLEVVGAAAERYEINKQRREMTIMQHDDSSADLLANPSHAFEQVVTHYQPELLGEQQGKAELALRATKEQQPSIRLTLDTHTGYPSSIVYLMEGLELTIEILSITPLTRPLIPFDRESYSGYELIDFR